MLKIHSIETFWTHEWPGIRFILFLQWCNFQCLYCHNADTIPLSKKWENISQKEVLEKIENSKIYFGKKWGITISGGECLLQVKDLLPFLKELKNRWFHIVIDTNWWVLNDDVKKLLEYVDLVLLDIKQIDLKQLANKPKEQPQGQQKNPKPQQLQKKFRSAEMTKIKIKT